jgi:hypothetical protein
MIRLQFHVLIVRILQVPSVLQLEHRPGNLIRTIVTMAATGKDPDALQVTDGQSRPRLDGGGETLAMMNIRAGKRELATPGVYPDVRHAHAPRRLNIIAAAAEAGVVVVRTLGRERDRDPTLHLDLHPGDPKIA